MRLIDLGGSDTRLTVRIEEGASFEFLISLAALGSSEQWPVLDAGTAWFRQVESSLSPDFKQAWDELGGGGGKMWLHLVPLALETASTRSAASLIAHIRRLSATELRRHLLGYYLPSQSTGVDRELIDRAVGGDLAAIRALLQHQMYFDGEARRLGPLLSLDAKTTKSLVMRVVQGWNQEFFEEHEKRLMPALERDAKAKQLLLDTTAPERAIELATGIIPQPMPGLTEIRLVPQFALRPWNVFIRRGELGIWCYPLADESLEQDIGAPPPQLVRLVKAIADEKRLRILRALSRKDFWGGWTDDRLAAQATQFLECFAARLAKTAPACPAAGGATRALWVFSF